MNLLLWLAACIAVLSGTHAVGNDVVVLDKSSFDGFINSHDLVLVEFYAPWCGHCKKLEPEYATAASKLLKNDPPVHLVAIDATIESELAARFNVGGYPTIKIFRGIDSVSDYNGPRDSAGIVKYMAAQAGPSAKSVADAAALDAFLAKQDKAALVGFFADASSDAAVAFIKQADANRERYPFALFTGTPDGAYAGYADKVVLIRPPRFHSKHDAEQHVVWSEALPNSGIISWARTHALPLVGQRSESTEDLYRFHVGQKALVTVYGDIDYELNAKGSNYVANRVRRVAKDFTDSMIFAVANKQEHARELDTEFGLGDRDIAVTVRATDDKAKNLKYRMEEAYSPDALRAFVEQFAAGNVDEYIKSEPVPTSQDGGVLKGVARNFDELVHPGVNAIVEFYAPWCGHCKSLAPIWEELGDAYAGDDQVNVVAVDATANDVPPAFDVRGFPTIYFVPANGAAPRKYEGERDLAAFKKYIEANRVAGKADL